MLSLSDFDYYLPEDLIAQYPAERREQSRLMIVERTRGQIQIAGFEELAVYLEPGDALVFNDTKVIPCRLRARKQTTGADIEILLLREVEEGLWESFVRPGRRVQVGTQLSIIGALEACTAEIVANHGAVKKVKFHVSDVSALCRRAGETPLPPYIKRKPEAADTKRYQTVYARHEGAVAAPTAGLHFSDRMLDTLKRSGVALEFATLHVGLGTFQPLEHEKIEENRLHAERYHMDAATARHLNELKRRGGSVCAVGTTTLRLLETVVDERGVFKAGDGWSDIFIYPGHEFRSADALLTNFHLPRSSLLVLVCAFAGRDLIMQAYETAVREKIRFYSYGDAMLIL
jgi:S-adenosylmethionine:tRNA ribosyltransferase-isomerase